MMEREASPAPLDGENFAIEPDWDDAGWLADWSVIIHRTEQGRGSDDRFPE